MRSTRASLQNAVAVHEQLGLLGTDWTKDATLELVQAMGTLEAAEAGLSELATRLSERSEDTPASQTPSSRLGVGAAV